MCGRFRLHVIAMDENESTASVQFDRIVNQFIGRSVKYLFDGMDHVIFNCIFKL